MSGPREEAVRAAFLRQSRACADLGSPFTAWICRRFGEAITQNSAVGRRLLCWPGDPTSGGDSVPLRLCGALHALALSGASPALSRIYARPVAEGEAFREVFDALSGHEGFLLEFLDSPPQTNEVARAAMVYPAFCLAAERCGLPVELLEVGASAGLNLNCDRFGYRLGARSAGAASSSVVLSPELAGTSPASPDPSIVLRRGCDIRPIDARRDDDALRLLAYVWPDQPQRMARMRAAIAIARAHPPAVDRANAVNWLPERLDAPAPGRLRIVYSTVAWQYLSDAERARGETAIDSAGRHSTAAAPLAWVRFEADGRGPGAAITLDHWNGGGRERLDLGRGDFHGRWLDWRGAGA